MDETIYRALAWTIDPETGTIKEYLPGHVNPGDVQDFISTVWTSESESVKMEASKFANELIASMSDEDLKAFVDSLTDEEAELYYQWVKSQLEGLDNE